MELLFMVLFVYVTTKFSASTGINDYATCATSQYLYVGEKGVIECTVEETFHGVYWYNSTDSVNENPLVAFQNSKKSGNGHLSGKFDTFQNGSLLIRNVTTKEDHFFRVIILKFSDSDPVIRDIRVFVIVKAQQPYPYIDTCGKESFCVAEGNLNSEQRCVLAGVRPPVNLTWLIRSKASDRKVPFKEAVSSKNSLYTTEITAMSTFQEHELAVLMICKAVGPVAVVSVPESMIIIENTRDGYPSTKEIVKHVTNVSSITLVCSLTEKVFIIWKKRLANGNWRNILIVHFGESIYSKMYLGDYTFDENGSLIVLNVDVHGKGSFMCIYSDGATDTLRRFEVNVDESANSTSIGWIIAVVAVIVIVGIIVVIIVTKQWKAKQQRGVKDAERTLESNAEEETAVTALFTQMENEIATQQLDVKDADKTKESKTEKGTSLLPDMQEKMACLLEQLKSRFKQLYTVLKAPCLSSERCSVHKFFVQRCFEIPSSRASSSDETSQKLQSYSAVFEHCFTKCSTLILTGDHGCGRLTLCLQMAYEWCEARKESYMKNYDIFILLHLKDLKGSNSLIKAIKVHLLPDAQLDENDVEELLMSFSSGLIALYGFDELQESDKEIVFDINSDELYSKFHFVVVTTKGCFPDMRHIETSKSALSGLDERFQNEYLKKNDMRNLMEGMQVNFRENPFLTKLCKIPVFFVLYVHISARKGMALTSITTLLSEMMSLSLEELTSSSQVDQFLKGDEILGKMAYQGFLESGHDKSWDANEISSKFQKGAFERYTNIGLLKMDTISSKSSSCSEERIKFCHRILFEWYAAFYCEKHIKLDVKPTVLKMYLKASEYMMCFLCTLYKDKAEEVLQLLLQPTKHERELPMMCFLELLKCNITNEKARRLLTILFKDGVTFEKTDTQSYQTSTLLCLEKAQRYKNAIIEALTVVDCIRYENCSQSHLALQSGLNIPVIQTLKTLDLKLTGQVLEGTKAVGILEYAASCNEFRSLKFASCILAEIYAEDCVRKLSAGNVTVEWDSGTGKCFQLDFNTGRWKDKSTGKLLSNDAYLELTTSFASLHSLPLSQTIE